MRKSLAILAVLALLVGCAGCSTTTCAKVQASLAAATVAYDRAEKAGVGDGVLDQYRWTVEAAAASVAIICAGEAAGAVK